MRVFKILLIVIFTLVLCLFAAVQVKERLFTDKTRPVISCDNDVLVITVDEAEDQKKLLEGVTATDNVDGDLTDKVMVGSISKLVSEDTAKITYVVFDSSSNMGTFTRSIRYSDYHRPRFSLKVPLVFAVGEDISLTGRLSAEDSIDGDLTDSIRVSAFDVSTATPGSYFVTVRVMNNLGVLSSLTLPVQVVETGDYLPEIVLKDWLIYLKTGDSFDPGSYLTSVSDPVDPAAKTEAVSIKNEVDTSVAGTYSVTYSYRNGNGPMAKAILTVVVE